MTDEVVAANGNEPPEPNGNTAAQVPYLAQEAASIAKAPCFTPPEAFTLSNETPDVVKIATCEGEVRLAPLEEGREFTAHQFPPHLVPPLRGRILAEEVRVESLAIRTAATSPFESAFIVAVGAGILGGYAGLSLTVTAVLVVGLFCSTLTILAIRKPGQDVRSTALYLWGVATDRLGRLLLLLAALLVAVVAPALAVYYGTGLDQFLAWKDGAFTIDPGAHTLVVARALQIGLIALASLLPALMFFQFRRERFLTIRKRMLHDVFRLDNRLRTLADMKARYGSQLNMLMDSPSHQATPSQLRPQGGSCTPLLFATFAISLGWVLILLDMSVVGSGLGSNVRLSDIVNPEASAFSYAFLGAYFFALEVVLRGYVRGDLTPKTYNVITTRILVSLILAWLVGSVLGDENSVARVLAFVSGIVPATGLHWLRDHMRLRVLSRSPALQDEVAPLTDLEGIDLYDRTRLADEGITNVQALAHHNLVELMLNTRIPVPRLVDWVDQAILYLHVVAPANAMTSKRPRDEDPYALLRRLRTYGIRTATDLIFVARRAERRGESSRALLAKLCDHDGPPDQPSRLEVALDALHDDEWMGCLRGWRGIPDGPPTRERRPARDRSGDQPRDAAGGIDLTDQANGTGSPGAQRSRAARARKAPTPSAASGV